MSRSISLRHIKNVGLVEWRNRDWWSRQQVMIWSGEHGAWWRPNAEGYTTLKREAWSVDFPTAYDYTKHCGDEKKINYFTVPASSVPRHDRGSVAE